MIRAIRSSIIGVSFLMVSSALGATSSVTLTVSGSILPRPEWQNTGGTAISTMAFAFSGYAGVTAATNVDSAAVTAKLVNSASYPATVSLTLPTTCLIGATAVTQSHISLVTDATGTSSEVTGTSFQVSANTDKTFALRFASAGNYGDKSGAVSCTAGAVTFTY